MKSEKIIVYCKDCGWMLGLYRSEEKPRKCSNPLHYVGARSTPQRPPAPRKFINPEQLAGRREKKRKEKEERERRREEERKARRALFKPCPFCGGERAEIPYPGDITAFVQCVDCTATGPASNGKEPESETIRKWNERAI